MEKWHLARPLAVPQAKPFLPGHRSHASGGAKGGIYFAVKPHEVFVFGSCLSCYCGS